MEKQTQVSYNYFNSYEQEQFNSIHNLEDLSICIHSINRHNNKNISFTYKFASLFYGGNAIGLSSLFFISILHQFPKSPTEIMFLASIILGLGITLTFGIIDFITKCFSWRKKFNQKVLNLFTNFKKNRLISEYQTIKLEDAISNKDIEYSLILYLNNLIVNLNEDRDYEYVSKMIERDKQFLIECFSNNNYAAVKNYVLKKLEYWQAYENCIQRNQKNISHKEEQQKKINQYMENIKKFSKDNKLVFLNNEIKESNKLSETPEHINLKSIL